MDRDRFRADHDKSIDEIDELEQLGLLDRNRNYQTYDITLAVLNLLADDERVASLLGDMEIVFDYLREWYRANLKQSIPLATAAKDTGLTATRLCECAVFFRTALILGHQPKDPNDPEETLSATEWVLRFRSFSSLLDWTVNHQLPKPPRAKVAATSTHGNVEIHASKREQVLGAALAVVIAFPKECQGDTR